jgi:hypothetical protein
MSDWAENLAKILPIEKVYDDAIGPAARQVGFLLEDVLKAIRIATFPLQVAGAGQDRIAAFLKASVARVPPDRQVIPPPQIVGPVLEGMRYEPDGPISEMFSRLLSTSMDADRAEKAHPAYPAIIRQLSLQEARFLSRLRLGDVRHRVTANVGERNQFIEVASVLFPELGSPVEALAATDHLESLGLISVDVDFPEGDILLEYDEVIVELTDFGVAFLLAAMGEAI